MTLKIATKAHVAIGGKKKLDEHILEKHKQVKKNKANKQLYLFTLHCELKPYAALKGVLLPNGPLGNEGVN